MAADPRAAGRAERPSAVVVLGTLSGFLAGFMYLAISVPLVLAALNAEEALAVQTSQIAAENIGNWLVSGVALTPERMAQLGLHWANVQTRDPESRVFAWGDPDPERMTEAACLDGEGARTIIVDGVSWASSCEQTDDYTIATGLLPPHRLGTQILYWIVMASLAVGMVTALGQARILRPLSTMSQALAKVGRGERGVRVHSTGLAELDDVVERINEAAEHVEERVDAITARITVVQEMARLVAHEIRNPLQSLELLTTLVGEEDDPTERTRIAASIRDEIRSLDQVVQRLLREGGGRGALRLRRKMQALGPLVEHVATLRRVEAQRRGIRLSIGLVSDRNVSVDGAMLGRSFENLVINAMQAVPDGTGEIRMSVFEEGNWLCMAVDDNGAGVPDELGNAIFEPEVTGRESGTGLGLALVRAVLVAHGGSIEYTTSPLGGARFLARLPLGDPGNNDG